MELVCPAGNLPSLKMAINNGVDTVYIGFNDDTNARRFAGLNFNFERAKQGVAYAHSHGKNVYVAINTYTQNHNLKRFTDAIDKAYDIGADAVILSDIALLDYAHKKYPDLNLHLSVQGSSTSYHSLNFYQQNFNIKRAIIARVLSVKQIAHLIDNTSVEIEVFGFGSLSIMAEGRCILSSYITGKSPVNFGVCSPASDVEYIENDIALETRLSGVLIDRYKTDEVSGYPTLCRGRFKVKDKLYYPFEAPNSLNTLELLPALKAIGVKAIKIEGRQRSASYVNDVSKVWVEALGLLKTDNYEVKQAWQDALLPLTEGEQTTLGAYERSWM